MKKSLVGAIKARERKKTKLEQVAHNCSQNISSMFNAITKKSSKLELVEPQPDEDHQEYLVDDLNPVFQKLQNIPYISNFFNTVQDLYKFIMNSQIRYELFVKAQKDKNLDVIHLKRLIDTRWAYWYTSIKKINMRFSELLEVLSVLSNEGDQTARAIGISNEMSTLPFILTTLSMEAFLKTVHCASLGLQNSNVIQSVAVNLINTTKESI
ncbi:hypothetical protein QTP88_014203 [Uroleucon formosanum]